MSLRCSALLWLAALPTVALGATLSAVLHSPKIDDKGRYLPLDAPNIAPLDPNGQQANTAALNQSQYIYVGCFGAPFTITKDAAQDSNYDPMECVQVCTAQNPNVPQQLILAAVHGARCGCYVGNIYDVFLEYEVTACTMPCKYYGNTICGGRPNLWGVFRQFDYQSYASHGAYDPWRYVWYSVVVLRESSVIGDSAWNPDLQLQLERYYLHATDAITGNSAFQFQARLPGVVHGLQYDLDSTRLVGLLTSATTGRSVLNLNWRYKLLVITIDAKNKTMPNVSYPEDTVRPTIKITMPLSNSQLAFTSTSSIMSRNGQDTFIFTQLEKKGDLHETTSRIYFISIPDGNIMLTQAMDFMVLQLYCNEKFGDVIAAGNRFGSMQIGPIAKIYFDILENMKKVSWQYNPSMPTLLVAEKIFSTVHLYPGLSTSEHLFNKTYTAFRKYPNDYTLPRPPATFPLTLKEVDLRSLFVVDWCTQPQCSGTVDWRVPYAQIFNKEPRIPLSLAAPSLVYAQFDIQASYIKVLLDRTTLKGARPVDTNGDMVPDVIDYTSQLAGIWDCGAVWDQASVKLLGAFPKTSCQWTSADSIQINLPIDFKIKVGNQIFLNPDTIYTIPNPEANEYSMAAQGGIAVSFPTPLLAPVIVITGNTQVDQCSDVSLSTSGSQYLAGKAQFVWKLLSYKDMTNTPGRIYNQTQLNLFKFALQNATDYSASELTAPSTSLAPATLYTLNLTVTSRWGLSASKTIQLVKLDSPAPMVSILGPSDITVNRTSQVALLAQGIPSPCATADQTLGYRWSETSGKLDLSTMAGLVYTSPSLIVPPFTLQPTGTGSTVNVYNFTCEVFLMAMPNKAAYASVTVRVQRSPIYVQLSVADRLITRGDILVLDARSSQDPDYPTATGMTFRGTFDWWCLTPQPGRKPCFGTNSSGYFGSLQTCTTDINQQISSGGYTFSQPIFDTYSYCRWARGVLMVSTANFTTGQYQFTIGIASTDGRTATKDIQITVTDVIVPQIMLVIQNPLARFPTTQEIRINGIIESQVDPTVQLSFAWKLLVYGQNPAYDVDLANQARTDPTKVYNVDRFIYLDVTEAYGVTNQSKFFTRSDVPNMVIKANVLDPSQQFKVRLIMNVGNAGVQGFAEASFVTAGLPPRNGRLVCSPINATMDTTRIIQALDWTSDDLPLTYNFGYIYTVGKLQIRKDLSSAPLPVTQTTVQELPIGEPSTGFTLTLYVDIITPFGVKTTELTQIYSLPPENATALIIKKLAEAQTQDGETATNTLISVLNIANAPSPPPGVPPSPFNQGLFSEVLNIMNTATAAAPVTSQTLASQAVVINTVIDGGLKNDQSMDSLDSFVNRAATNGLFSIQDLTLVNAGLSAIGSILPDSGAPTAASASAQSLTMAKYVHPEAESYGDVNKIFDETSSRHILSTAIGRREANHPKPQAGTKVIYECLSAYCDEPFLTCVHRTDTVESWSYFTCCDAPNPETTCEDPPCWFQGNKCPADQNKSDVLSEVRRLSMEWKRNILGPALVDYPVYGRRWSEDGGYEGLFANSTTGLIEDATRNLSLKSLSRRLQATSQVLTIGQQTLQLEQDEVPILSDVRAAVTRQKIAASQNIVAAARKEVVYDSMPAFQQAKARAADVAQQVSVDAAKKEAQRIVSSIITRALVLRDIICKAVIVQLTTSEPPMKFLTPGFILYIGKTRNMSDVNKAFVFPDKYVVPPTAPDYPTPTSSVTAFAFIFCEYTKNIYGWSPSAPPGNQTRIITLITLKASTTDLQVENETEPIRIFADQTVYSSGLCMFWDRFAAGTAGGAWSTQGLLNDGNGCLTTHLSDIGLFVDGRPVEVTQIGQAISYFMEEVIDVGTNYTQMAVLGFVLLLGTVTALWGYIQDEVIRDAQRTGKQQKPFNLGGDGVTSPLTVLDPIAYDHTDDKNKFLAMTFWKVIQRDHAFLSPLFYHEVFTRPQRILCLGVLTTGILAVNAAIYGVPHLAVSSDQFIPSGVISSLLVFPLFCGVVFMFQNRPTPAKRRLVKKPANRDQLEAIAKVRQEVENKSSMLPAPGYYLPALPPPDGITGPITGPVGNTTLLALPAPMQSGPGPIGGFPALPGLPAPPRLPVSGFPALPGVPGLPGLPPLPMLKAGNPALMGMPPLPKYPQPPMRMLGSTGMSNAALMPPPPAPPPGMFPGPRAAAGLALPAPAADYERVPMPQGALTRDPRHQAAAAPHALMESKEKDDQQASAKPKAASRASEAEEAAGTGDRRLRAEPKHMMAPPLPPLSGPPPPPAGGLTPPGGMTPTGGSTPKGGITPAGSQFATPRTPPPPTNGTPGSWMPATPKSMPLVAAAPMGVSRGIVHRGDAPTFLAAPFMVPIPGGMPGMPPPPPWMTGGTIPGTPGFATGSTFAGMPAPPPPPPPPPREDDPTFVRRVRLAYIDRASKVHQQIIQGEGQDPAWQAPDWVFNAMLMSPYVACSASIMCHVLVNLAYSTKFGRIEERNWYYACATGMFVSLFILEVMRSAVTTVVELRKFEIRRRLVGGDFLRSKIKKTSATPAPDLKASRPVPKKPAVPLVAPKNPPKGAPPTPPPAKAPSRPTFLPPDTPAGPGGPKGIPPLRSAGGQALPVGPPAPPMGPHGVPPINMTGHGRSPIPSARGIGTPIGTPGGAPLLPGRMDGTPMMTPKTPKTPLGISGGSSLLPGRLEPGRPGGAGPASPPLPAGMGGAPPSPGGSAVTGVTQALTEKLKASRVSTPPPPPTLGQRQASQRPPSPSMAAGSQAGSRPASHRSGDSRTPPKPPTPPPPGTLQQTRALRRAQQDS